MNNLNKVRFHFLVPPFTFRNRTKVKGFILKQLENSGRRLEALNYIFCDDIYLLSINQKFLSHDTLTDIITFELSPKSEPLLADIYISVERVRDNAKTFNTTFSQEFHRVMFHGLLHILGYKDKTKQEAKVIRSKEDELIKEFFSRGTYRGSKY